MADDLMGLTSARAVWDFTTGDARRFFDRVSLMKQTAESFIARGVAVDFAMLIHGPATQFVAKTHAGTKFDKAGCTTLPEIHTLLDSLMDLGVRIEVCLIAMDRSHVARSNLISRVVVEDNVFLNSIALQNKGYACMQVD
ncbi:MAG TPA: DsrE family protein [Burkholderiales bacterium]|nr:DsrE family protein [Burkholderiales bacterium]